MSEEEWRPVLGYPGYYVSNLGAVVSYRRPKPTKLSLVRKKRHGYLSVNLRADGRTVTRTVHSLVAEAFIGPRPPGMQVLHGDGNQLNNHAENLRYGTASENMRDAIRHGFKPTPLRGPGGNGPARGAHCKRGHRFDHQRPDGRQVCRTCVRRYDADRKARKRATVTSPLS